MLLPPLTAVLIGSIGVCFLAAVLFCYDLAGWKLRAHPWLGLVGGCICIFFLFIFYAALYQKAGEPRLTEAQFNVCVTEKRCTQPQVEVILKNQASINLSNELQLKFFELIIFPFFVFFLVFAVQAKIDASWENKKLECELENKKLNDLRAVADITLQDYKYKQEIGASESEIKKVFERWDDLRFKVEKQSEIVRDCLKL